MGTIGLLYDIGKVVIDKKVLNKAEELTVDGLKETRHCSGIGYRTLSSVNELAEIADIALEHYKRWDGKGYPKILKGEKITIEARILSLVEAYDVMIYEQPYQKKLSKKAALNEIEKIFIASIKNKSY
jgi:HD-GYP domain-containing protein (c-di-GMP phosphodiesterase class II)